MVGTQEHKFFTYIVQNYPWVSLSSDELPNYLESSQNYFRYFALCSRDFFHEGKGDEAENKEKIVFLEFHLEGKVMERKIMVIFQPYMGERERKK